MVTKSSTVRWYFKVRDVFCILYLFVFVLFEVYSAAATALDHSGRFPPWESIVGWFLFVLPCELMIAMVLLLDGAKAKLGLNLVLVNLCAYVGFMYFETSLVHDGVVSRGAMWEVVGIWAVLIAGAVGSAGLMFLRAPRPS